MRYGKLSKLQSGQAPREMTKRQSWVYQQMGFLKPISEERGPTEVQVLRPVQIPRVKCPEREESVRHYIYTRVNNRLQNSQTF